MTVNLIEKLNHFDYLHLFPWKTMDFPENYWFDFYKVHWLQIEHCCQKKGKSSHQRY
uniref:Uncharacterized protein n=1 Tax=Lepeophtheirus salmonis TaxID=72036 RepID=A0A0K2TW25_LEPSM